MQSPQAHACSWELYLIYSMIGSFKIYYIFHLFGLSMMQDRNSCV
uniref:Uncharacterized protein n=1 Tax=Rhizophora mucronata TaxID=61149 RepID=A0A2P2QHB7_RHIMU